MSPKRVSICALLALMTACSVQAANFSLRTALGTSKYLQDEFPAKSVPVSLDAAGNEYEPFQVILRADKPISSASVRAYDLKSGKSVISASNVQFRLAHYIQLKDNVTGGFRKGFYPDALFPMPTTFSVEQGKSQMVWADIYVPSATAPGVYKGKVDINIDGVTSSVPVSLAVHPFALSVKNHFGSAFALWADQCSSYYNIPASSPEYKVMIDRYYWFMVGYRLSPDDLPVPIDSPKAAKYLNDPRVSSFRIPYDPNKPEEFKKTVALLREKGWLSKGYIYTMDEPSQAQYPECAAYGRRIDALAKDAKWLLTAPPNDAMNGTVDLWCPIIGNYSREDCEARQRLGETVWWYTCCGPQHPYPTYLINDTALSPRILSWFQFANNVEGVLYWSTSIWLKWNGTQYLKRDVWNDPLAFPGANGDGYLLYPGKTCNDDPIPSLRLEMIRQGNEDFETLCILQNEYRQAAAKLGLGKNDYDPHWQIQEYVGQMGSSLLCWNNDANLMAKVRRQVFDDIEHSQDSPLVLVKSSLPEGVKTYKRDVSVDVWAEKGAKLTAALVFENGAKALVPVKPERIAGKNCTHSKLAFKTVGDETRLVIRAAKGKSIRTVVRTYKNYSEKPVVFKSGTVFSGWNSDSDLKRWTTNNSELVLAQNKPLGNCAKLTFEPGHEYPDAELMAPTGFQDTDWSSKNGYFGFSIYNPNDDSVNFVLKLHDFEGKSHDGVVVFVAPHEAKIISWPISDLMTGINAKKFRGFMMWTNGITKPITVYLGPMYISNEKL